MLIVNGAAKIILSALMAMIDLFSSRNFLRDVLVSFHFNNPFLRGYKDGYDDGRHYKDSKLRL